MDDKINQALVQIENELEGIVSARKQVEETIKSSTDLQKVVSEYVSSVKKLADRLKLWDEDLSTRENSLSEAIESAISQLSATSTAIITAFHTDVVKIATEFKTQTESTLSQFVEQNKKLEDFVQKLNALHDEIKKAIAEIAPIKEKLDQISKDLNDSQKEQDVILGDIKQKVTDIPATIKGYTDAIIEKLETINQGLKTILDSTNTKIDLLNEKADNLKNATAQILSTIQSTSETLTNAIMSSKEETARSININRWIIIIGIIILAALQFILK